MQNSYSETGLNILHFLKYIYELIIMKANKVYNGYICIIFYPQCLDIHIYILNICKIVMKDLYTLDNVQMRQQRWKEYEKYLGKNVNSIIFIFTGISI